MIANMTVAMTHRAPGAAASEVIADTLNKGYSQKWQEQFLKKVARGIAAAESDDFATAADTERVKNKYRNAR
ncbi:hypothetical protein [Asticcacaulis sp. AC402]|uniref:hypothetical protein n=1 Tax=Asticcacaulis sp. AC402 TaxID=1282361 RepID=UPI0003C3EAD3|nr:hypothetical protein [Asticcacaulis sp. AC402]ESQ76833.1 hypothetical protein ABAC402_03995 [Asticcacaulis sp. AC402]